MKVCRRRGPEVAGRVAVEQQSAARRVGDVEQIPRYAQLEQAGSLIEIPVGKRRTSLGAVPQLPPIVAAGREEGAVPPEASSIGDHEE
jgi:hypothetical protein